MTSCPASPTASASEPGEQLLDFLWSVAYRGSLAEAFGATNYAIEGVIGEWSRLVLPAFRRRCGDDARALMWLVEHAEYDDAHPREALELVKLTAREDERERVESVIRRSLELFPRAFDGASLNRLRPVREASSRWAGHPAVPGAGSPY